MSIDYLKSKSRLILKLFIIYILNCLDLLFSYSLLKTRDFDEANPLMHFFINTPALALFIKVFIPGFIFMYLFHIVLDNPDNIYKLINIFSTLTLVIYSLLNIYHIYINTIL